MHQRQRWQSGQTLFIVNYPQAVGMGFLAGAFWGGLLGIPLGAVAVPIISLYMGF